MDHIKFTVSRTAHTYTLGESLQTAKYVWFVFHGYGQLASNILRKFEGIDLKQNFVISVEGLSRFYWAGVTGEVAASWMTKEDRLDEIADYLAYLDQVYDHFQIDHLRKKFCCLAFSQGAATCWRWIAHRQPALSTYIQWAGTSPPELDYKGALRDYIQSIDHHFVVGDKDQFITPDRWDQLQAFLETNKLSPEITRFEGKHKISRKVLHDLITRLQA